MVVPISPQCSSVPAAQNEGDTDYDSCDLIETNNPDETEKLTINDDDPYFGNPPLPHDKKQFFRILSANLNNLPIKADDDKNTALFTQIHNLQGDCVLMQELGLNWSLLSRKNSWRARVDHSLEGYKHI